MDDRTQKLILDFMLRQCTQEELAAQLPAPLADFALAQLREAVERQDPIGVELSLSLAFAAGLSQAFVEPLLQIIEAPWHHRHEDVVSALDRLRVPRAVEALHRTALAQHDYLAYDEAYALGVKCIWALGNLASESAIAALARLQVCGNPILDGNARAQLSRLSKGAPTAALRAAATLALRSD